ncbi:class IV adenylate cyclase [Thermococcus sp. M39]|uniref:class IV adenylate cyclase n=1 Tax=unclassified Thermococcus TaxID=2627626 RepID=UPI0014389927|nr:MULTISPECIES: class IV adenylate cyclase [unclassified Thermococcus]NJE07403.1 class IV adenylate cyclase [Thermococcus sp. M39]NJE12466.1 class IV adenylate cyclase [Thermococcus sp. LS2]
MEIEIKFRVNLDEIKKKIEALGAEFVGEEIQEDLYFSLSPKRLLRIRRIVNLNEVILGYKDIKDEKNEEFDEIEVKVEDFEKMKIILKRLGFKEDVWVKKHRYVYKLGDVTFELNHVEGLGDFLDIEVMSDDIEKAKKRIWEVAKLLGLSKEDVEPRLYQEMLKELPKYVQKE